MHNYTLRHAVYLTLIVGIGALLWITFCLVKGLPFHPWSSAAIGVLVGTSLFFFAGLDPAAMRTINHLFGLSNVALLVCVGLAAVFGARGGPFPLWALIPLLICGGAIAAAVIFFGVRSVFRVLTGRHIDRQQLTPDVPDEQ